MYNTCLKIKYFASGSTPGEYAVIKKQLMPLAKLQGGTIIDDVGSKKRLSNFELQMNQAFDSTSPLPKK